MPSADLIRLARVGARELQLDDETRRGLQERVTGKASLADMSDREVEAVIGEMKRLGFRPKAGKNWRPTSDRGDVRYAHKLWSLLHAAGKVEKRGAAGLNAFLRARFSDAWGAAPIDIDRISDPAKVATVIEALKAMCRRAQIKVDNRG
jgi:hypothetical protein